MLKRRERDAIFLLPLSVRIGGTRTFRARDDYYE